MKKNEEEILFLYSTTLLEFQKKGKQLAFSLLESIGIEVRQNRFRFGGFLYPLSVVVFEHPSKLGFFNAPFFEIGLHKDLLYQKEEIVIRILKHELAHYLTYLHYGSLVSDHGAEFSSICKKYGWEEEKGATMKELSLSPSSPRLKLAKLLNLANSQNIHEANLALMKAKELIAKHGLTHLESENNEPYQMRRILEQKKSSQKLRCIAEILSLFHVHAVINHGLQVVYLEIFGLSYQVEIAEYVGITLSTLFEDLWKKEPTLTGLTAKNSFFRGITAAFIKKTKEVSLSAAALISIEKALHEGVRLAYPTLRKSRSYLTEDKNAYKKGLLKGSSLELAPGIRSKKGLLTSLLPF